jgi:DNA-binding response OmpR family regulator
VWNLSSASGTNVVDVYINYLRRKLHDGSAQQDGETPAQPLIGTVRGFGYHIGASA